ncbi:hypothetical protein ACFWCB_05210 [Streptomyces sp. NPDC060048]|uniref:hypothetical protein n=1 Tax=unclassified Streptomyces TaxID=2593676 RepID=UPI0036977FCA
MHRLLGLGGGRLVGGDADLDLGGGDRGGLGEEVGGDVGGAGGGVEVEEARVLAVFGGEGALGVLGEAVGVVVLGVPGGDEVAGRAGVGSGGEAAVDEEAIAPELARSLSVTGIGSSFR